MKIMLTELDFQRAMYITTIVCTYINLGLSIYGAIAKPNFLKKLIMLTILGDSANLFAIMIGYKLWRPGILLQPPILLNWSPSPEAIEEFIEKSVDPLPQALVLTAIVIGLAVTLFLTMMILLLYRHFGTVDADVIGDLKRKVMLGEDD